MDSAGFFFKLAKFPLCCAAALLAFSCATGSFARLDNAAEQSRYAESAALLEKRKNSLYAPSKDSVLYFLDKGMLSHYAKNYAESSRLLESGERAIETAYTRSVTREIGSYLLNDTVLEYPGEDYEDIYINAFNALNYFHRGNLEDAMVEIRRMNNKTARLSAKYNVITTALQKEALELGEGIPANLRAAGKFTDSALARYLGMLFYRSEGLLDDARIDGEGLRLAFANAPAVYNYPAPASISGELHIPKGMARFNVLAFSGLSPVKRGRVLRIPLPGPRWAKIALPELEGRRSNVTQIEVVFDNGRRFRLELLEDIEAVTRETFKARQNVLYLKSVLRAMVKGLGSSALDIAAQETGEDAAELSLILGLLSISAQIFAEASEQADLRISRYFPARAYVGGVNIEPGVYSFRINYYNKSGREIDSVRYDNMHIREGALNLAEAVSLK